MRSKSPSPRFPEFESRFFTVEEYWQREVESDEKHWFFNGFICLAPDSSVSHVRISGNSMFRIRQLLDENPNFEVWSSAMKIHIPRFNIFTYSDTCVVSGESIFSKDAAQGLLNPALIVEVLSEVTREYDQNRKFEEYKTIPTFREYVLFEQEKPFAKSWFKGEDGKWKVSGEVSNLDSPVVFESIGVAIPLSKFYEHVSFETESD